MKPLSILTIIISRDANKVFLDACCSAVVAPLKKLSGKLIKAVLIVLAEPLLNAEVVVKLSSAIATASSDV